MMVQIFTDDRDPESICTNFDGNERLSFEAHDQIRVMATGSASNTDFGATFTVSTILRIISERNKMSMLGMLMPVVFVQFLLFFLFADSTEDMKCPEEYFNCCEHLNGSTSDVAPLFPAESSICIPQEWTCDGKKNCPTVCADEDEKMGLCQAGCRGKQPE